jgi:hypothetical protein
MSRWAEMFAALSEGHDTVDTVDTVAGTTDAAPTVSQSVNSVKAPERAEGSGSLVADEQPRVGAMPSDEGLNSFVSCSETVERDDPDEPTLLRDGRRMHRFRAADLSTSPPADAAGLVDDARWRGVVLVADGRDLIVVERWLSNLPEETLNALRDNAGDVIAALLGESRQRTQ